MTTLQLAIREKRTILRDRYGGMMTLYEVMEELGLKSRTSALAATKEMGIPATKIGRSKRYDTDILARRLVELRDMC